MKLISLAACTFLLCLAPLQANPRHPKGEARITKNEAEHIALKNHLGARVTAAKLEKVNGKLVWSLMVAAGVEQPAQQVQVDAITGRLVPAAGR